MPTERENRSQDKEKKGENFWKEEEKENILACTTYILSYV